MEKLRIYIKPILCVIALIAMFMPFAEYTASTSFSESSVSFSGITVAFTGYVSLLLIVLPVLSLITTFLPQYSGKKEKVSLLLPIICIVCWFIAFLQIDSITVKVSGGGIETDTTLATGAYIMLICYIALGVLELIPILKKKNIIK